MMKHIVASLLTLGAMLTTACSQEKTMNEPTESHEPAPMPKVPAGAEVITLGAGCFWCTEAVFQQIPGVVSVTSGYMGGSVKNPNYEQVCTGETGHAEVSQIVFDPKKAGLEKILETFWHAHNPTQLNRQGNDVGTQYRSAIFYSSDAQRDIAEKSKKEYAAKLADPVVTEITKAGEFWPAEKYHQDYYRLNKNRNPYCQMIIAPKLKKLGLEQ